MNQTKLLLTAVVKPYGVKDEYSEWLGMEMELFDCQLTRNQGVHSPRANYRTNALYLLAENVSVPTTVLDFPGWDEFVGEIERGYTHVGISFSGPNVYKAKRMAEHIRSVSPGTKIILGGYAAGIPEIRDIVPCDEVCAKDGIRWLREYFGESPDAPVRHPLMSDTVQVHMYGARIPGNRSSVLFTGLGCNGACFFCATASKFGRYIPLFEDGRQVFDICRRAEAELGAVFFSVQDENFLIADGRARQLEAEMERHGKTYRFFTFSSAEAVARLGVDFLVRMGVTSIWIGVESRSLGLQKTRGIDLHALIRDLQDHGISVIASMILFLDHHDKESIEADVNWALGLGADINQFLQLMPVPGTPLFSRMMEEGRMGPNPPYPKMNGQNELPFKHPHFTSEEAVAYTNAVSLRKYRLHGPGLLSMALTSILGYKRAVSDARMREEQGLAWNPATLRYEKTEGAARDEYMQLRLKEMKSFAGNARVFLLPMWVFAPGAAARRKAVDAMRLLDEVIGRATVKERVLSVFLTFLSCLEYLRHWAWRTFKGIPFVRQPPSQRIEYRQ
ncbi:MAG: radical SAM protein [Verrucomicrobia bacterium]|nr:radical SAM protein [Verrucomicrobiota bacterium]